MTDQYLLGIDYGTESCRVGIFTADGRPVTFAATPYETHRPRPSWAEQSPDDWWNALVASSNKALSESGIRPEQILGIGYDATSYSLVPMDANGRALRNAIMWMDVRATKQAARADILESQVRRYNAGGTQPSSAEWAPFKIAWLKENEPDVYNEARWLLDAPDWLGAQLTGEFANNTCSASIRMYHDRTQGGFLHEVYQVAGCGDAFDKLPEAVNPIGTHLGNLTKAAAEALGLKEGTPVAQGGIDAEHGMVGLNVLKPGRMSLTTGSSHVMLGQAAQPISGMGFWGAFTDAVVPGLYLVETSGVSTGSALNWFKDHFAKDVLVEAEQKGVSPYDILNEQSKHLPPGSEGLIINEYFQGNRTPYSDSKARGVMLGSVAVPPAAPHVPGHSGSGLLRRRAEPEGVGCFGFQADRDGHLRWRDPLPGLGADARRRHRGADGADRGRGRRCARLLRAGRGRGRRLWLRAGCRGQPWSTRRKRFSPGTRCTSSTSRSSGCTESCTRPCTTCSTN